MSDTETKQAPGGEVILGANRTRVNSVSELRNAVRSAGRSIASSAIRSSLPRLTGLMLRRLGRTHPGLVAGILALVLFLGVILFKPEGLLGKAEERKV